MKNENSLRAEVSIIDSKLASVKADRNRLREANKELLDVLREVSQHGYFQEDGMMIKKDLVLKVRAAIKRAEEGQDGKSPGIWSIAAARL